MTKYSPATVAEVRGILKEKAANRALITYTELAERIETADIPAWRGPLPEILGEVSTQEVKAGRGMLSCLVVAKADHSPGSGFFDLARELYGPDKVADEFKFWREESAKVCNYWKKHQHTG
jgi:hypothetical protein